MVKQEKLREDFERFKAIVSKSKLTEKDGTVLADQVKLAMCKKLKSGFGALEYDISHRMTR